MFGWQWKSRTAKREGRLFEELEGANLRHVRVDVLVRAARDREPVARTDAVRLRPRVETKRGIFGSTRTHTRRKE